MKNLKKIRKRQGMSIQELSDKTGINRQTIWLLESGKLDNARLSTIKKLAYALECDMQELLDQE